jgi:hypothetical protein
MQHVGPGTPDYQFHYYIDKGRRNDRDRNGRAESEPRGQYQQYKTREGNDPRVRAKRYHLYNGREKIVPHRHKAVEKRSVDTPRFAGCHEDRIKYKQNEKYPKGDPFCYRWFALFVNFHNLIPL